MLTQGTAPPPPFSLGTGPFGVLCGRTKPGFVIPQGDAFYAPCHEAGGHMGDSAYDFLGMIIDSAGGSVSDRMAFKAYALQRLHAANFRGFGRHQLAAGDSHGAWCPPWAWPAAPGDRPPEARHQI